MECWVVYVGGQGGMNNRSDTPGVASLHSLLARP